MKELKPEPAAPKRRKEDATVSPLKSMKESTRQGIMAIGFFILGILTSFAPMHLAGPIGDKIFAGFTYLFGVGYYLLPILFFSLTASFLRKTAVALDSLKIIGILCLFFSGLGLTDLVWRSEGGLIGGLIAKPLEALFAFYTSLVILVGVLAISTVVVFEAHITAESLKFWKWFRRNKDGEKKLKIIEGEKVVKEENLDDSEEEDEEEEKPVSKEKPVEEEKKPEMKSAKIKAITGMEKEDMNFDIQPRETFGKPYTPPPLTLLERDKGKPGTGDIKANANIIKRTLLNFGIDVEMDEVSIGPSVTRYALKPAEGVKLSKIVGLQNDLSLALAAHPLRIEAPIPGKSLVGIEIPNTIKSMVGMATLFANDEYQTSEKPLLIGLGKGISGKSHFANLAKMPHLLIAGTTGSGKSVTIHVLIQSLLFRNSPEQLKFIMIDPKRVELTLYNKIPHLLTPVITEAKKAILALKWAAKEMDRRYDILEAESVRDIESYHKTIVAPAMEKYKAAQERGEALEDAKLPEPMPYMVIIIDELADIMQTYPRELEAAIVRLAQMSRAVGIHLVLSTQRPSVNVITGLIKANVPSRIALQVASQIDSRTILDAPGAEKLLGAGDMLYLGGEMSKPMRIQSAYISETEVKKVAKYLADEYADMLPSDLNLSEGSGGANGSALFDASFDADEEEDDDMYEAAREEVMKAGKASTSYIQRKLRVGYARAARLVDLLEQRGVIGPADGAKPREVIGGGTSSGFGTESEVETGAPTPEDKLL